MIGRPRPKRCAALAGPPSTQACSNESGPGRGPNSGRVYRRRAPAPNTAERAVNCVNVRVVPEGRTARQTKCAKILCMVDHERFADHGDDISPTPYPVDATALRTLAHPLRSRLLAELRSLGPATATDLAESLRTNTGATSYHLRRLAAVGLVVDTGAGRGRRRLWAANTEGREVRADEAEDDAAAAEWLARDYVQHFAGKAQDWIGRAGQWSPTWQDATGLEDRLVLVTDDQLATLRAEVDHLLARYRRLGAGNPQAKRVTFYTCAFPVDPPGRSTRAAASPAATRAATTRRSRRH